MNVSRSYFSTRSQGVCEKIGVWGWDGVHMMFIFNEACISAGSVTYCTLLVCLIFLGCDCCGGGGHFCPECQQRSPCTLDEEMECMIMSQSYCTKNGNWRIISNCHLQGNSQINERWLHLILHCFLYLVHWMIISVWIITFIWALKNSQIKSTWLCILLVSCPDPFSKKSNPSKGVCVASFPGSPG